MKQLLDEKKSFSLPSTSGWEHFYYFIHSCWLLKTFYTDRSKTCAVGNIHCFVDPETGTTTKYRKKKLTQDYSCRTFPMRY